MLMTLKERLKLIALSVEVFVCYSLMAVFEEKIFKKSYDGEEFKFPTALGAVFVFSFTIFARIALFTHKTPKNEVPQKYYAFAGIFFVLSLVTSNIAILYVPYVVQVVGRCKIS